MSAWSTRGTWAENVGLHFKVIGAQAQSPSCDRYTADRWVDSLSFCECVSAGGAGEMLAPRDFPVLGEGERQAERQRVRRDRDGGPRVRGGERRRGSEGREGEEAEETLLNASCEHRDTSTWKQPGLNHPQNMPL